MKWALRFVRQVVACSLLLVGGLAQAQIRVTGARIGCLDIQKDGNLTGIVASACNNRQSCSYKAPTPQEYTRAGVRAATRSFCTQAMEITYECGPNDFHTVTVPGDAWNHPPAELVCKAPPPPPGGSQPSPQGQGPFPISKSQQDPIHGVGYMHTDVTISKNGNGSGQLAATTHTWSAKDFEGFHGSVAVAILDQNQRLLWVSQTQSYGVDGKHVPFGGPSDRTDKWNDTVPAQVLLQTRYLAIKQRWNPKAVTPEDISNWLRGIGNGAANELGPILQAVETTITQDLSSPTVLYIDARGYRYVETSDSWKKMCTAFPCFGALQWPDYATKWFPATINGQPVVIQLWKGYCEKFLGLERFPGGIGAEVGIYRREPGRARPRSLPFLPPQLAAFFLKPIGSLTDNDLWWAYPELNTRLSFTLVNPITNKTFFSTGTEKTYWLNRWTDESSYSKYKQSQGAGKTPTFSVDYRLEYTINGIKYSW
jgi:hypothetical protein